MEGSGFILNSFPFQCCGSAGIPCVIVPSPSDTNNFSETIDVMMLPGGLYFCRVGKDHLTVFKFVVIK
jgi:hypothetical protein